MHSPHPPATDRPVLETPRLDVRLLLVVRVAGESVALADAIGTASEGGFRVEEAVGSAAAMSQLANASYDAVLILHNTSQLDGLELAGGMRAGGHDQAVIMLGAPPASQLEEACYAAGADAYCCLGQSTPRLLVCTIRRAIAHSRLGADYRRLAAAERRRLTDEHREAERLLAEQRRLVTQLESLADSSGATIALRKPAESNPLPSQFSDHSATYSPQLIQKYRELLEAYVVMGAGNLASELSSLASLLVTEGMSGRQAIELHLGVVEQLVEGLGARSARHVMNRADLLVLELMVNLADGYRQRYDADSTRPALPHQPAA